MFAAATLNVVHVTMAPDIINMSASASSSSSSSSCPPSSSAITITAPGKSILKRPPPQQPSLFSRITRFLPTQAPASQNATNDESKPLKRAHFILPEIAIVYPISSINPPSTPTLKDEKRAIEDKEKERRKRVVRGSPGGQEFEEWWSMDKVESFYRECCAGCDEQPDPAIKAALKVLGNDPVCILPELIVL
jgi:protein phosphatase 1 regulatory subunit 37